jgi:hypothetical protein
MPLQQQQQQLQPQQESSWLSQQRSTLCVSPQPLDLQQQQQLGSCDELPGDALDAFMVETQMVSGDETFLYAQPCTAVWCSVGSSRALAILSAGGCVYVVFVRTLRHTRYKKTLAYT